MSELLSPAEVQQLTGARARASQCDWLVSHGVPYKRDGSRILVSREHVRLWLAGAEFRASSAPRMDLVR